MESTTATADVLAQGVTHHMAGRFAQADGCYARVVEADPDHSDALRLRGVIFLQTGDLRSARRFLARAIVVAPGDADAHSALGNVNEIEGRLDEARAAYGAACAIDAAHGVAATGRVRLTLRLGAARESIEFARQALSAGAQRAGLLRLVGAAWLQLREYADAADACRAALAIEPSADAYANLSAAYVHLHHIDEAIEAANAALALEPTHADAANNLGIAHKAGEQYAAALAAFALAIELGSEDAHVNLGTTLLLLGDYRGGWPNYGWISPERRANPLFTALPMWDGSPLEGRRFLIWPEQGIGDTLQMARFAGHARAVGGTVTFACPTGTRDVLRTLDGVDAWVDAGVVPAAADYDCWLPAIRLPVVFGIEQTDVTGGSYLRPDPVRQARFRAHIDGAAGLRVGLVWSGSPNFAWNDIRSMRLSALAPLSDIGGITWFALQHGPARDEALGAEFPLDMIDARVADFADTAAIIAQLDLVITVDTSVAHLAGALGKPVWVLLSKRPDWRWGLAGDSVPWYSSARLFRQGADGTWAPVIVAVGDALRKATAMKASRR